MQTKITILCTKFMRRNAAKSRKLAAILDFGGHFDFSYLTA